jgi:hypothetical protein
MKPRYFAERPSGCIGVWARDVPNGTVVMDRDGFWGVLNRRHPGFTLYRWDAPPTRIGPDEQVLVPYAKRPKRKDLRT